MIHISRVLDLIQQCMLRSELLLLLLLVSLGILTDLFTGLGNIMEVGQKGPIGFAAFGAPSDSPVVSFQKDAM